MKKTLTLLFSILFIFHYSQNLQWVNTVGGINSDFANSAALDSVGNIYTTGYFMGAMDFDFGPGTFSLTGDNDTASIFIRKTDSNGNFIWAKQIRAVTTWVDYGPSIYIDKYGNIYLTGHFWKSVDFDPGPTSFVLYGGYHVDFAMKLNSWGNFMWAKKLNDVCGLAFCITTDSDGNVYTGGTFADINDFDPGPGTYTLDGGNYYDSYISKLDSSGNFIWARKMGGTDMEAIHSLKTDVNGNIVASGYFKSINADFDPGPGTFSLGAQMSSEDIFICKLNSSGNLMWVKQIGGPDNQCAYGLTLDNMGNVYTAGRFGGTTDFDPGPSTYFLTAFNSDAYINKLDTSGNFVWAKLITATGYSRGSAITTDLQNNILTTGYANGATDFDPGTSVYSLTPTGSEDAFISKLDASGNFICAGLMGGISYDKGYSIITDKSNNVIIAGSFQNSADFEPGPGTYSINSNGNFDAFVAKFKPCNLTVDMNDFKNPQNSKIFPNPSSGHFTINNSLYRISSIKIFDCLGSQILSEEVSNKTETTVDLTGFKKGIYFIEISTEEKIERLY